MSVPIVVDRQLRPVAYLDTAADIAWELKHNELNTAEMSLGGDDPKNSYCQPLTFVRLWDGERDLGIYRFSGIPNGDGYAGGMISYSLEHALATLLDDVIYGTLELTEVDFAQAIRQLLEKQTTTYWQLGDCDFDAAITLPVENETILSGVQKCCEQLEEEYIWQYDTSTLPFILHIRRAEQEDSCGILYGRNLIRVRKIMDASSIVTRLYLLGGADEQGSQVTVERLTEGGVPYIDADTVESWGVKCAIYQNGDITSADELLKKGRKVLEAYKNPFYTYEVEAVDLSRLTGRDWDRFEPGKRLRVMDDERGVHFSARIVSVAKRNARQDPGSVTITLASQPRDQLNAVTALTQKLQSVESNAIDASGTGNAAAAGVKKLEGEVELRATREEHNALTNRVVEAESALELNADYVALLSGRTDTLETESRATQAQLRVNNDSLATLVTRTDTLDGQVNRAESAIEQLADDMTFYVKKDDDISALINLSGDGVLISGGTIRLTGYVLASELASERARIDELESSAITATTLSASLASLGAINLSGGISANAVQAQYGDFTNISIGNAACHRSTLTIGGKSCSFFAPADAVFDLSDMPGYDAALDAARTDGAASVYVESLTCTNVAPNTFYVAASLSNGSKKDKSFTIQVGQHY